MYMWDISGVNASYILMDLQLKISFDSGIIFDIFSSTVTCQNIPSLLHDMYTGELFSWSVNPPCYYFNNWYWTHVSFQLSSILYAS
jgi:hypothetical protein